MACDDDQIFYLKRGDTRPILEVVLRDPPTGSQSVGDPHDLSGADSVSLHIQLTDGTELTRTMTITDAVNGVVQYAWLATDWDTGNLVVGPSLPLSPGTEEHRMEYEVKGPGAARLTFPNGGYHTLRVYDDFGDA
jgi:hypothetical protein